MKNRSKKVRKNNPSMVSVKNMSFIDLYAMHTFAKSMEERPFMNLGKNVKAFVRNRTAEIENELMNRTFGYNPFSKSAHPQTVFVQGEKPESVDLSKFDGERFVVAKNEQAGGKE